MHRHRRVRSGRGFQTSRALGRVGSPREDTPSGRRDLNVSVDEERLTTQGAVVQIDAGRSRDGARVVVTQS